MTSKQFRSMMVKCVPQRNELGNWRETHDFLKDYRRIHHKLVRVMFSIETRAKMVS